MNSQKPDADQTWQNCPTGTLTGFASRDRSRRRWRTARSVGGTVAVVMLLLGAWYRIGLSEPKSGASYGGIYCSEVKLRLDSYRDGSLDARTAEQIREHLEECSPCRSVWRNLTETQRQAAVAGENTFAVLQRTPACPCARCADHRESLLRLIAAR